MPKETSKSKEILRSREISRIRPSLALIPLTRKWGPFNLQPIDLDLGNLNLSNLLNIENPLGLTVGGINLLPLIGISAGAGLLEWALRGFKGSPFESEAELLLKDPRALVDKFGIPYLKPEDLRKSLDVVYSNQLADLQRTMGQIFASQGIGGTPAQALVSKSRRELEVARQAKEIDIMEASNRSLQEALRLAMAVASSRPQASPFETMLSTFGTLFGFTQDIQLLELLNKYLGGKV